MNGPTIHIVRDGSELGVISVEDAAALLATGFLRPTDQFRSPLDQTLRPLTELTPNSDEDNSTWLHRTKSSLAKAGHNAGAYAAKAVRKLSQAAQTKKHTIESATERLLEDFLPQIRQLIGKHLQNSVTSARSALKDEVFLRKLFGAVYDCLPKPITRFVAEQGFIDFCMRHRERLLTPAETNNTSPQ